MNAPRLVADASNNQRELNVRLVAQHTAGMMHKATQGLTFVDAFHRARSQAAHELRYPFGSYHYADIAESPLEQAHAFLAQIAVHAETLQPALDVEAGDASKAGPWAREWMRAVHGELGVWPLFYSYPDYIARMRLDRTIGGGLWLSSFSKNDGADHPYMIPAPWRHVRMHQFTSVGVLAGVPVRLDLSHTPRLPYAYPIRARMHAFSS